MSDNVSNLPLRGKTFLAGPNRTPASTYAQSVGLEGTRKRFKDLDYSVVGAKPPRTGRAVECILVRNASGITLLPKRTCKWKAGFEGLRVDGYCFVDFERVAGVVDDWLPATGVVDDDLFWLVTRGPCLVKNDIAAAATAHIDQGSWLVALTAATSQATTAGRLQGYVGSTSNQTVIGSMNLNKIGVALSGKTSGNTNADVLADIQLGY